MPENRLVRCPLKLESFDHDQVTRPTSSFGSDRGLDLTEDELNHSSPLLRRE